MSRIWVIASVYLAVGCTLCALCGFTFLPEDVISGGAALASSAVASMYMLRFPRLRKVGVSFGIMIQYALIFLATAMLASCAATLCFPLRDSWMLAADRAIGYHWLSYARFVSDRPIWELMYSFSYTSILWQPVLICLLLTFRGQERNLVIWFVSTLISLIIVTTVFSFVPVTTAWIYNTTASLNEIKQLHLITSGDSWVHRLLELRAGRERLLSLDIDPGVIGFPSFHCVAVLLNIKAVWEDRSLRPYFLALNGLMLAATPLNGGHYIMDLFAGAVVAFASYLLGRHAYSSLAAPKLVESQALQFIPSMEVWPISNT